MKVHFLPKTTSGKWSVALIFAFIVFLISFQLVVASGQRGGETFFSNLALAVPILIAGISGVSAFVTGLIGIIRTRERSVIVYLSVTIGLIVLLFLLGEIIFPH
jgi:hypothetical protein